MEEFWRMLIRNNLTPNQFYLLYSIQESETTPLLNTSLELRILKSKGGWFLENGSLSAKAQKLIKEVDGYFKREVKRTNRLTMGSDFADKINKYNLLWPKMRLPSGKAARAAVGNLEPAFRWFFDNYKYSWETILQATSLYLDHKEAEKWEYTRNSQYFIRKQNNDKSWGSDLADYCQLIEDGGHKSAENHFSENVF